MHGHLHANEVMWTYDTGMGSTWHADYDVGPDPRYLCVCVEQTDFTPLHFDEVEARIQKRWQEQDMLLMLTMGGAMEVDRTDDVY